MEMRQKNLVVGSNQENYLKNLVVDNWALTENKIMGK